MHRSDFPSVCLRISKRLRQVLPALVVLVFANSNVFAQQVVDYRLGSGDHVRVTVFGEEDLSGEFEVDGSGQIAMPLIGTVDAGGKTGREVERLIVEKLKDGYLNDPKVSIDVLNYRPFYILGEVNAPGSYPYRAGMTVLNAVVMGGGYTYRARENDIVITRNDGGAKKEIDASPETAVLPGDVIRVKERFF